MAVRKQLSHDTRTREKIQTSQLINRLQENAFGKIDLTQSQLKSIEILLRKSLPDLTSISLEGPGENGEHLHKIVREFVSAPNTNG